MAEILLLLELTLLATTGIATVNIVGDAQLLELIVSFLLGGLVVLSEAAGAAQVAEDAEEELDGGENEEGVGLLLGVLRHMHLLTINSFLLVAVLLLCEPRVVSELHDGQDEEEVHSDERREGAVETAARVECRHIYNYNLRSI